MFDDDAVSLLVYKNSKQYSERRVDILESWYEFPTNEMMEGNLYWKSSGLSFQHTILWKKGDEIKQIKIDPLSSGQQEKLSSAYKAMIDGADFDIAIGMIIL